MSIRSLVYYINRLGSQAAPPHISVSEEAPLLEFDREGNTVPDILAPIVTNLQLV